MTQRDYAILWVGAKQGTGIGTAFGGDVLLTTGQHAIDGPEHTGELPDVVSLMAGVFGVQLHGSMGATETFDASAAGYHSGTLDANCTFTFAGATDGSLASMILEITQDGTGGRTITLPGSVPNAAALEAALDPTAGVTTFYVFFSRDGGVNWYGFDMGAGGGSGSAGLLGFYNVQDYGAVGDGSTDDTASIVATFDAADATGGGIIYFPPTTSYYKIVSLITRTGTSKYHLLGGGGRYGPARVHQATSNTGAFKFAPSSGTANRVLGVTISDLIVSGAGGASSGRGIEIANDCFIDRIFVYGFYDDLYVDTASYYSHIRASTFTDADNAGIRLVDTNNTIIDACRFTGLFGTGSAPIGTVKYCIYATFGSPTGLSCHVLNSSIEYFTDDGIYWDGGDACSFVGNYYETQQSSGSSGGKAHIRLGASNTMHSARIAESYFQGDSSGGPQYAIATDHVNGLVISDSRFGINAAIGITSTANSSNFLLWNIYNNPAGTFTLPTSSFTLDPASPPLASGTAAGGDLSGTYPNPSVVDDSHNHTAATLPAVSSSSGDHEHMVDVFTGDGSTTVFELTDEPLDPEMVVAFVAGSETAVTISGVMSTTATFGSAPGAAARVVVTYPAVAA